MLIFSLKQEQQGLKQDIHQRKKTNCRLDRIVDPGNWDQHVIVEDVNNLKDHLKVKDITTKCVFLILNKVILRDNSIFNIYLM